MFREPILMVGEWLYVLMDGVPLMNSPLVFLWFLVGAVIITASLFVTLRFVLKAAPGTGARQVARAGFVTAAAMFFPVLIFTMGVPLLQLESLQECRETEGMTGFGSNERAVLVKECRDRQEMNRFADFGEWTVRGITPR